MFNITEKMTNRISLIIVILFAFIITFTLIYQNIIHQIGIGYPYIDIYLYLIEASRLFGIETGGYKYINFLPPFIPFLTSLLFRIGFVSEFSIFITTGIFYIFGILGMYYILKLRFNNYYSTFGAIFYGLFKINMKYVGNGLLDTAFIALMLWAIYFFILAMEKNQNYFYIAIPLAIISFFTKYPGGLIFPLMLLYFMGKTRFFYNIKKYSKGLVKGAISGIITLIPFGAYFFIKQIPLRFIHQAQEISSTSSLTATGSDGKLVGNDLFFYIKIIEKIISFPLWKIEFRKIILLIAIIGLIITIYFVGKNLINSFSEIKNSKIRLCKWNVSSKLMYLIFSISLILILISFLTASLISFAISELLLFTGLYLCAYSFTKIFLKYDNAEEISSTRYPYLLINIVMIGFFLSFLVFFSAHLIKQSRYSTSMAPGIVFLITLSIETLMIKTKDIKIKKINLKQLIPIFIILVMLLSSINYINHLKYDKNAADEKLAVNYLKDKEGVIMSDRGPVYTFYLKKEVKLIRDMDQKNLDKELLDNHAEYVTTFHQVNLTHYSPIKEFGNITIYKKNNEN